MTVREDAVEALLMEGSTNTFEHYSEFCNTQKAEALARSSCSHRRNDQILLS